MLYNMSMFHFAAPTMTMKSCVMALYLWQPSARKKLLILFTAYFYGYCKFYFQKTNTVTKTVNYRHYIIRKIVNGGLIQVRSHSGCPKYRAVQQVCIATKEHQLWLISSYLFSCLVHQLFSKTVQVQAGLSLCPTPCRPTITPSSLISCTT